MAEDHPFSHIDQIPEGLRPFFEDGFNQVIELYVKDMPVHRLEDEHLESLTLLIELRDGRTERVGAGWSMGPDQEKLVQEAYMAGRGEVEKFLAQELHDHARGSDPETRGDRRIIAMYADPHTFGGGHSWQNRRPAADVREIREIQQSLRWLSGEGIPDRKHYFRDIPVRIRDEVGRALEHARDELRAEGDADSLDGAASIEHLIEGGKFVRSETHWTVVDSEYFQSTYLPDLESELMNELVEKGFLDPEKQHAPKKSFSMER